MSVFYLTLYYDARKHKIKIWIHTLLRNAASSLSRTDSVYLTGPIHPCVHYITWKMRDPVTQWRYIISKMNGMLCVSLSYVSCSCAYYGCFEITQHKTKVKVMQSVLRILQLVQVLGPLRRTRTGRRTA